MRLGTSCNHLKVAFVSLGCAKNLVDSERMLAWIGQAGHILGAPHEEADVIVINKIDSADIDAIECVRENIRSVNPDAIIIDAASPIFVDKPERIKVRTPTLPNWATVLATAVGQQLADMPMMLVGIDPCFSCNDRMVQIKKPSDSLLWSWEDLRQYGIEKYK